MISIMGGCQGQCWYTNVEYPIPFNPPFISCENPVGYYRREFEIENGNGRKILHFAGVDNAFFVYMNGEYVGFSKGSRLPAEFDVTEVVHEGTNVLTADGGQERTLELVHMQYGSQSDALSETYEYKPRKPWKHEYADCSGK